MKPKLIVNENGTKHWFLNGKRHRIDGPAVIYSDGTKYWFLNGKRHREDGPAVIYPDGWMAWWIDDKPISQKGWLNILIKRHLK